MQVRTTRRLWLLLVVLALLFKAVYLAQYTALPFLYGPLFDAPVYLEQAASVRAGRYGSPALIAFSPLYGYFLAAAVDTTGRYAAPIIVQLFLGVLNMCLIGRITSRWFGPAAGLISGALYLGYGLLVFYETKLMSETLGLTLLLCALWAFSSMRFMATRPLACLAAGALLALATLARASLVPALPFFALSPLFAWGAHDPRARSGFRSRLPRTALFVAGICLVLGLHGAWTKHHTGLFVPVILVSNTAAQASRAGEWKGELSAFAGDAGRDVSAWNVVEQARVRLERVRGGDSDLPAETRGLLFGVDAIGFLRAAPTKFWLTWRDVETSFDYGYYGERSEIGVLQAAVVSFGLLVALAALGAVLAWREARLAALWPMAPIAIGVLLTTTLFHPSSRYRLPLVLVLLPLAAHALVALPRIRNRHARFAALAYTAIAIVYFVANTVTYRLSQPAMWELRVAEAAAVSGAHDQAKLRIRKAAELAPGDPGVLRRIAYVERIVGRISRSDGR